MTFSEDQNKALDAKLTALSESLLTQLSDKMNTTVNGLAKRLIDVQLPKTLQDLLPGQIESSLEPALQKSLDQFLSKLAQEADSETEGDQTSKSTSSKSTAEAAEALADLRKQLQEQATNTDTLKEQLAQERKIREQLAEAKRVADYDAAFVEQVTGKVRNPKQLLLLLNNEGRLGDQEGVPMFKTKDEFGSEVLVPVTKQLPDLLQSETYAHYAPPRPGTGTGASPGDTSRTPASGQYFRGGSALPDTDALVSALNDPAKQEILFQEAQSLIGR